MYKLHEKFIFNLHYDILIYQHGIPICSPPSIPMDLVLESSDMCYIFRAVAQNNTDFALKWMNKWKNESRFKGLASSVLWACLNQKGQNGKFDCYSILA